MKVLILALVLGTIAPLHVTFGPVSVPVLWLLAAVEALAGLGSVWLAVRAVRRFRSCPRYRAGLLPGGAL